MSKPVMPQKTPFSSRLFASEKVGTRGMEAPTGAFPSKRLVAYSFVWASECVRYMASA